MKQYVITEHAIERAIERLGIAKEHAKNHLLQLMQTAYFTGETPTHRGTMSKVFDHYPSKTRLIVGDGNAVITVYSFPVSSEENVSLPNNIKTAVSREFRKMQRQYKHSIRKLNIEWAETNVEIAQLLLNKAKARSPKIQSIIQGKIDELKSRATDTQDRISSMTNELESVRKGVGTWMD